jgi:hypothetical protein
MLALEPPGNVARDIVAYKRSFFSDAGDGSALAYPDAAALSFFCPAPRPSRAVLCRCLDSCWPGIEGAFGSAGLVLHRGLVYLDLRGPVAELSERASRALADAGLRPLDADSSEAKAPFDSSIGFFVCRAADPKQGLAALKRPPSLSFRDCSLAIIGLRWGSDPFAATSWRCIARSKRRTGPPADPSRRRPRS